MLPSAGALHNRRSDGTGSNYTASQNILPLRTSVIVTRGVLRHDSDRAERALLTALHAIGEKIVATTGQTKLRHAYAYRHSTFGMMLRKTQVSDLIDLQIPELLCWICAAL